MVCPVSFDGKNLGVYNKMIGQGRALRSLGCSVRYAFLKKGNCIIKREETQDEVIYGQSKSAAWSKYRTLYEALNGNGQLEKVDVVYIRHLLFTQPLHRLLLRLKSSKKQIIYEFPTYPYDQEWDKNGKKPLLLIDRMYKEKCLAQVDLVVHYGGFDRAMPSVEITNGVEIPEQLSFNGKTGQTSKEGINVIAVGRWAHWHGLDRAIHGLAKSDIQINLEIIGDGPELNRLKNLTSRLQLHQQIKFLGLQTGTELSERLLAADIALGTLGIHRKGVKKDSSLKHRLYAAYGLPIVLSAQDDDFSEELPFVFKADVGEGPLKWNQIKNGLNKLQENENYKPEIYSYAKQQLSWKTRMEKVMSFFDPTL